jgi:putative transposase
MKKSRFTESQIVKALKEHEGGMKVSEISRSLGIVDATFYQWKNKYGGMEASDVKRLKELEEENSQLKRMYADSALELQAMKALFAKKGWALPAGMKP